MVQRRLEATFSPAATSNTPVDPAYWPAHVFRAMGSTMSVRLAASDALAAQPLRQVERYFAFAEGRLSRFDPRSELSRVNGCRGKWQEVSPLLWQILGMALAMASATDGLYDPTLLAAIESAGYTRSFDEMIRQDPLSLKQDMQTAWRASELAGRWQTVRCRPATREIYLPSSMGLDLGGIAKGVVAAQVVELLRPYGPCLVDAAGDLVAGAAPPGWPGWPVAIAEPAGIDGESEDLAVVWLREASMATSGIDYRRWQQQGHSAHHIIDPRTGLPAATDLLSVSVLAAKAEQAEAWAKAALILGWEAGYAALASQQLAALLVHQDGRIAMTDALQPYIVG